jgi:tetratricopeptide (TPR) repeat protein
MSNKHACDDMREPTIAQPIIPTIPIVVEVAPYENEAARQIRHRWGKLLNKATFGPEEWLQAEELLEEGTGHLSAFDAAHVAALANTMVLNSFTVADYEEALKAADDMGRFRAMARRKTLNNLAAAWFERGQLDAALECMEQARKIDASPCVRLNHLELKLEAGKWDSQSDEDYLFLSSVTPKLLRWSLTRPGEPLARFAARRPFEGFLASQAGRVKTAKPCNV